MTNLCEAGMTSGERQTGCRDNAGHCAALEEFASSYFIAHCHHSFI